MSQDKNIKLFHSGFWHKKCNAIRKFSAMNALKEKMIWVLYFFLIAGLVLAGTITI